MKTQFQGILFFLLEMKQGSKPPFPLFIYLFLNLVISITLVSAVGGLWIRRGKIQPVNF